MKCKSPHNSRRVFFAALVTMTLPLFANAAVVTGGTTTVTLDSTTVSTLTGLGFTIAPVSPATLGGTPLAATFPITGGDTTTMIDHSGGLSFSLSGTTASITDFIINLSGPEANVITGTLMAGAVMQNGVPFFDIGSGLSLTLDAQLANGLSTVFGVPNLTGAPIGTASVNPTVSPEPASFALAAVGLGLAALVARRRRRA